MSLVQRWLREASQPYVNTNQVYSDVDAALSSHPTVRPKTDVYTYDDGRAELLICIHGLLPISFRGASYNIPIAIWIPHEYPKSPPIVYVVPTSDMLVKKSQHVDPSGRCNFPYQEMWERKSEGCSLHGLLDIMQEHFSREPPLYAKPKQTSTPLRSTTQPTPASTSSSPAPPPRPGQPPPRPQSMIDPHSYGTGTPTTPSYRSAPIHPPLNPQSTGSPPPRAPSQHGRPMSVHYQPVTPQMTPSPPPPPPPPVPGQPRGHVSHQSLPAFTPPPILSPQHTSYHQQLPYSPPQPQWQAPAAAPPPGSGITPSPAPPAVGLPQYVSPPQIVPTPAPPAPIRAPAPNLMDEEIFNAPPPPTQVAQQPPVPADAPPRPMNPQLMALHAHLHEKFSLEMNKMSTSIVKDSEGPRSAQNDLLAGEPAIQDEMRRLESVKQVCLTVGGRLREVVGMAENSIAELKRKGDPEVDELVVAMSLVHNQLVTLIAEDHAIEDTIYHLHRALNDGRLDLDRFLRTTTRLAEEQFMKRALVEKITSQLPMGMRMM